MSQDVDRELARLWRVSRTVHEMVRDRGYLVAEYEIEQSFEDFKDAHGSSGVVEMKKELINNSRNNMHFTCDHSERTGDRLLVWFCPERNVPKSSIKIFLGQMEHRSANKGILIHPDKMGSAANKAMMEMQAEYHLESFSEADLLVNITRHFLVPKHTIMRPEEKAALIKRYRLKETQLPRIMITDPVAKYYGMRRGQVMKIERASETAGRYITYRICM
ncbi:DNA-directed RNA polymerase I, II, and III subunit RPABC1 [Tremella mesenterica]|uniref:DNA-directed RNA polymerases I, II, and III subunit RPABC1 n=1 Tax=Tremella mesenterica TaxID=5217 RepID=A0A4Q1BRR5_TREME|nr:DNA-directed RNA polymerase I, II, and III subunit RPABC1 [Tremella mesenterica]